MNDWFAKLHDIELPSPVGMWPLAPGWYLLMGIAVLGGLFAAVVLKGLWRRYLIRTQALATCDHLQKRYQSNQENICGELSVLLRRVTLAFHPQSNAAKIEEEWIDFLNNAKRRRIFSDDFFEEGLANLLRTSPYQRHAPEQTLELLDACRAWIKRQG